MRVRDARGGLAKIAFGDGITAESAGYELRHVTETGGIALVFLLFRAFASGCTALTGVEAVSNGVPAFEKPKSRNAAATLVIMGALSITMFAGITALAIASHVHMAEDTANLIGFPAGAEQRTAISQIGIATFGESLPFYLLQAFTAAILILAANTAFNGFPVLSSLLGRDNYLPHQLANRGDRLVFSNGIVLLALVAGLLIVAFNADVTRLIQLYILGVFLSFTLSQAGMVRHWTDLLTARDRRGAQTPAPQAVAQRHRRRGHRVRVRDRARDQVLARGVDRGRRGADPVRRDEGRLAPLRADRRRRSRPSAAGVTLPSRVHSVVLVSNLLAPTLRALAFAEAISPATLRAVKVAAEEADDPLPREWQERGVPVPLVVIESPYRETVRPVLRYVRQLRREYPGDVISIVIPEYVVAHWWEHLLHNQTALRLKGRLLFEPSVAVTSVPWVLGAQQDEPGPR